MRRLLIPTLFLILGVAVNAATPEATAVLQKLHTAVPIYEAMIDGKPAPKQYAPDTLYHLAQQVGDMRLRDAIPDLLYLLDNHVGDDHIYAEGIIAALGKIRDERAIVPLLGQFTWNRPDKSAAAEALVQFERPLCPQIILDVQAANPLLVRRGLFALRVLAEDRVNTALSVKLSAEERIWFTVSEDAYHAVVAHLQDTSPLIRYEALATALAIHPEQHDVLAAQLANDTNAYVHWLRALPDDKVRRLRLDHLTSWEVDTRTTQPPADETVYRHNSPWVPFKQGCVARVGVVDTHLVLPEGYYLRNAPVWVHLEIGNPTQKRVNMETSFSSTYPLGVVALHDAYGRAEGLYRPKLICDVFGKPLPSITIKPGEKIAWAFNLLDDVSLTDNGVYTIRRGNTPDAPLLLTLQITGLPQPLWRDCYRGIGDPNRGLSYPRLEIPAGPAVAYSYPELARPPDAELFPENPVTQVDADGNIHRYFEKYEWVRETQAETFQQPINPKYLTLFDVYYEAIYTHAEHLLRWVRYEKGKRAQSMDFDGVGRLTDHLYYDRHGDPDRGIGVAYTPTGKIQRRVYYGPLLRITNSFRYTYDNQDRRIKEERFDADGKLTDYFILDPLRRDGAQYWYQRFDAAGKPCGTGWMTPD